MCGYAQTVGSEKRAFGQPGDVDPQTSWEEQEKRRDERRTHYLDPWLRLLAA